MPVSLEQQRAAVGAMAISAAPKSHPHVSPHCNKCLQASDPMDYKQCVVSLVTMVWMVMSCVKQGTKKMKDMVRAGCKGVCGLVSSEKTRVLAMRLKPSAVMDTPLVYLLMILLCGHILKLHYHDTSGAAVGYRKMPCVSEGTMIVFVDHMLLMIAGDVEPNPGPVTRLTLDNLCTLVNELHHVRDEWYNMGLQLHMKVPDLRCIKKQYKDDPKDCLREMLTKWLETAVDPSTPTWQRVVDVLSSPAVDRPDVAQYIKQTYCSDEELVHDQKVNVQSPVFSPNDSTMEQHYLTEKEIKLEMEGLETEFESLKEDVYESVQTQNVDLFKFKLTSFKVNDKEHHMDYVKEMIIGKDTVTKIWIELNCYLNFLNYELLQHILTKFKNSDLQSRMDSYNSRINTFFCHTRLCDFTQCWPIQGKTPPVDRLKRFVVNSSHNWETCTLKDLYNLRGRLATKLLLPGFIFILEKASKGSVTVSLFIPISLVDHLKSVIKTKPLKQLVDIDIERMTVDGVVCYEDPVLEYTKLLKQTYISKANVDYLSDSKGRDLLPFRLASVEKQMLSSSEVDRFTRETLRGDMDDVVYKKTAMELRELGVMEDGSQPQVVLIEGRPGTGKTTFAWEQCRQWAEGKVLGDYSIVLLLPLRDNNIRQIRSLPDLFQHSRGQVRDEVSRRVAESDGKGCLIWLEAWDELPYEMHKSDSLFTQLIQGTLLSSATIFVTSRPWATRSLLEIVGKRLSQRTELLALAKEEVENEIRSITLAINSQTSSDFGFDFSQFIESNPMIRAAMYTPASAVIIEHVFRSAPHNPPTNVTQLYSAYVLMRLEQHLSQHPKYSHLKMNVRTLADLPEEVISDFQVLCRLAYEGVSQQVIVFSSLPGGVSTLSLLQTVPQVYDEGEDRVSYNFLHYTIQEYLAALHLSHLQPQQLLTIIDTKCLRMVNTGYSKKYYEAVQHKTTFQFLAGITKLEPFPVDFLSDLLQKDEAIMYRWLYESQNQSLLASVLGSGKRGLRLPHSATTTDYYAAGYCLAYSNCMWMIDFKYTSIDDVEMEFFSKGCNPQLLEIDIHSQLVSASFWRGSITGKGVGHFLTLPNTLLQHIQHLNMSSNKLDRRGCELLAESIQRMPCLETLDLSFNLGIGHGGIAQLLSSLRFNKLRELDIRKTGMSDPDFESVASYVCVTSSLEKLSIGENEISAMSMHSFCRAVSANNSMRILDINWCVFTTSNCVSLGELLQHPIHCRMEKLHLIDCKLTSDGVEAVMNGLSSNHTLKEFNISNNQIGSEGAVTVAKMLKTNSSLERLNLTKCCIGISGGVELGTALERNNTLRYLDLSSNALGDNGVKGLCIGLKNNSSLKELNLWHDKLLGERGVLYLLKCVEENNTSLKRLNLSKKFKRDLSSELRSKCEVSWGPY